MIGKIAGAAFGRSFARKRGFSPAAGMAMGLFAPFLIRKTLSVVGKGLSARAERRRERRAPHFVEGSISGVEPASRRR
jgi:hypothetical protein